MKKSSYSDSEIITSIREMESGVPVNEICRRLNISTSTLYQWRKNYSGLDEPQMKRLKELEEEISKLKKMNAELAQENDILREVIEKKSEARAAQRNCARNYEKYIHSASPGRTVLWM